jgi:eukaryotic-like serine/threonine-protein kinase
MNTTEHGGQAEPREDGTLRLSPQRVAERTLTTLLEILCADLVERWRRGDRVPVESYLGLHPELRGDAPEAFELIYGEFVVREDLGESPTLQEYQRRFPQWAERLQRQVELHGALKAGGSWDEAPPEEAPRESLPSTGPAIPGYEILGECGRGGVGVVYKARQISLNRLVALKVFRGSAVADPADVRRFRREAEVAAGMRHPNFVQIYEVGQWQDHPYLALEYVEGGSLQQWLAGNPQEPRSAAVLVESLGRAIHHAHQRGIVHRDLKPANILLQRGFTAEGAEGAEKKDREERGRTTDTPGDRVFPPPLPRSSSPGFLSAPAAVNPLPKITDFGLAKELSGPPGATRTGDVLGTPGYMAPEQAAGKVDQIGPATDVYALGAILYECLTGRPPFGGATPLATLAQVVTRDPVAPSQLQPGLPRDLETISMKCLAKEPQRRYRSAEALADDLRRFLSGEPIHARPASARERLGKWAWRHPSIAALTVALVLVTGLGFALVSWQWGRAEARAEAERRARRDALESERAEKEARQDMERLSVGLMLDQGMLACEQGEVDRGLLLFARGLELAEQARAADLEGLARLELSAWRPHLIRLRTSFPHKSLILHAVFSPDGAVVLTGSQDRTARLWRADTGNAIGEPMTHDRPVWCVAFAPDGRSVLTGSGEPGTAGEARLWDAAGKPLGPPLRHDSMVSELAFNARGDHFLTVTPAQAQVWNTATRDPHGPPLRHGQAGTLTAVFSPDGNRVATGGDDRTVRIWDVRTGEAVGKTLTHEAPVLAVAFAPDGRSVLSGDAYGIARLWDVATGEPRGLPMLQRGPVKAVAFSRDGRLLATGGIAVEPDPEKRGARIVGGEACLWSPDGRRLGRPLAHPSPVWAVAFSPDSQLLLTGCEDAAARVFRVRSGELIGRPLPHEGTVRSVAFRKDGGAALTASAGGDGYAAARLWELSPGADDGVELNHPGTVAESVAFSPNGRTLLMGHNDGRLRCWKADTAQDVGPTLRHSGLVRGIAFEPQGHIVCTTATDNVVRVWEWPGGRLLRSWQHPADSNALAFRPDGAALLTGGSDGAARLWDVETGNALQPELPHPGPVRSVSFSPDGRTAFTVAADAQARAWDAEAGRMRKTWPIPEPFSFAVFGPNDRLAVGYFGGRYVQIRKLSEGEGKSILLSHPNQVIQFLAFSPDGVFAASVGTDRTCRLWHVPTGRQVGPPLLHPTGLRGVAFRPDGRRLAVSGAFQTRLWDVTAPVSGSVSWVRLWAESATGLELDEQGRIRPLSAADQTHRREQLQRTRDPVHAVQGSER